MVNRYYDLPGGLTPGTEVYHWNTKPGLSLWRHTGFGWVFVAARFWKWGFFIYRSRK